MKLKLESMDTELAAIYSIYGMWGNRSYVKGKPQRTIYSLSCICNGEAVGERSLLCSIIWRAYEDVTSPEVALRNGARRWFFNDCTDAEPDGFNFLWLCNVLDLNPELIRAEVKKIYLESENGRKAERRRLKLFPG